MQYCNRYLSSATNGSYLFGEHKGHPIAAAGKVIAEVKISTNVPEVLVTEVEVTEGCTTKRKNLTRKKPLVWRVKPRMSRLQRKQKRKERKWKILFSVLKLVNIKEETENVIAVLSKKKVTLEYINI